MSSGTLYLIPVPLGAISPEMSLPVSVIERVRPLTHFVVENAKSARGFLKAVGTDLPLQALQLEELNEHTKRDELDRLLSPLRAGQDVGLLSEAGCPAVADPGADLVALAQQENIRVVPLIGPSSLLLALMASGLNGQRFAFQGYLPAKETERAKMLHELENESRKRRQLRNSAERRCQGLHRKPHGSNAFALALLHILWHELQTGECRDDRQAL